MTVYERVNWCFIVYEFGLKKIKSCEEEDWIM